MRIDLIRLLNFQSFADSGEIPLGNLTVFAGKNNSGKSAILNAIRQHQSGIGLSGRDVVRVGASQARVQTHVSGLPTNYRFDAGISTGRLELSVDTGGSGSITTRAIDSEPIQSERGLFPNTFAQAVVLPLLADRTIRQFDETVNAQTASAVRHDTGNIAAVMSSLVNASEPRGALFNDSAESIFGFRMGLIPSQNGQIPGLIVDDANTIALSAMGTGVISILRMLAYLVMARDKVILIEEPENDLHPEALKHLLRLIAEASRQNQVLVTTHSHIVVNALGGSPDSRIYRVAMSLEDRIPTATVTPCDSAPDRLALLRELGYELTDFGLHEAFLLLEESSAESVIARLMAWFAPRLLGRLRTVAAYGVNDVEPRLSDLKRLFVFVHLEEVYKERAWVLVDGDPAGKAVVEGLKADFKSWPAGHFIPLGEPDFEMYYPSFFAAQVSAALDEAEISKRRQLKEELLHEVLAWADSNEEEAKAAFERSASEVIAFLRSIEDQLTK